ncbi:MAG: hypothetical protein LiPW15_254 [Parcubacteria group bacterium LiPW_15]|nr:MAG: hypothetical protein LiPW15_254 [Parcubacteria group bacterium LiPW_15]
MRIRGILIVLFFPLLLNAQDNETCKDNEPPADYNDPMEAIKARAIKIAQDRYVRLEAQSILEEDSDEPFSATAVRVGCRLLISNFHALQAHFVTREPVAAIGPVEKERLAEISVKGLTSPRDLIAIESETAVAGLPPIKFAEKVSPGEVVLNWSNANGRNGFLKFYYVARGEKNGFILLDRPAIPGESGFGLFNLKGELVGIVSANIQRGDDNDEEPPQRFYGMVIAANTVKAFLRAMDEDVGALNECKK